MKTTQTIGALAAALAKAQGAMRAAAMDRTNPHFKSKYATLASIIDTAREPLAANGLSVVQGTSIVDGRLVVTTLLMHASGEWIEDSLSIKPQQDSAQALGSAITYGRRYAYAAMIGIVSDEDDDGEAATTQRKPAARAEAKRDATVADKAATTNAEAKAVVEQAQTDAATGAGIAEEAQRIVALVQQIRKVSNRRDVCLQLSALLARPINGSADLTDENERKELLAWLEMLAKDSNEAHRNLQWERTAQAYAEREQKGEKQ